MDKFYALRSPPQRRPSSTTCDIFEPQLQPARPTTARRGVAWCGTGFQPVRGL